MNTKYWFEHFIGTPTSNTHSQMGVWFGISGFLNYLRILFHLQKFYDKGNPTMTIHKGNPTMTMHKGNPTMTMHKGNQTMTMHES
jgi:hypothetical protein